MWNDAYTAQCNLEPHDVEEPPISDIDDLCMYLKNSARQIPTANKDEEVPSVRECIDCSKVKVLHCVTHETLLRSKRFRDGL